jgi:S1-C subfamily serine protease
MIRPPLIAALAVVATTGLGCGFLDSGDDDAPSGRTTTRVEVVERGGDGDGFNPRAIYRREAPGVVTVVSMFDDGTADGSGTGVGSGFVLDGKGEIATNAHVVTTGEVPDLHKANSVYVEFADGNQVEAEIRGYDPDVDVALVTVDPKGLTLRPLPLGDSDTVDVGEPVAAIGSPFNERQSLSIGVVSAIDRSIGSLTAFDIAGAIQTDAAVNPGNSGGPLVSEDGTVIGINQQIKTDSGGGEGVGFAVPINAAKHSLEQLRRTGKVAYAYLGVETAAIYPQLRERFGLPVGKGAWVQRATSGGPAEEAGVKGGGDERIQFQVSSYREGGDVITRVAGRPIGDPDDLARAIAQLEPGRTVKVEVWRDDARRTIDVELGDRPLSRPPGTG